MIKAIIKSVDMGSSDDFASFWPADEANFGVWLNIHVGPEDEAGSHQFQFLVCTPDWIREQCSQLGVLWGRHMLIVSSYDHSRIIGEIACYIANCTGDNFWKIAQKIARVGAWEYEDYNA
jgi:hypothetical protein